MRGVVHGFPQSFEIRLQPQAVPFRLFRQSEPGVTQRKVIVQAAYADGVALGNQLINQDSPRLLVIHQRVAVVGERQGDNALSQNVRNPEERKACLGLSLFVKQDAGAWFPSIRFGKNFHPLGRMKDAAGSLLHQLTPQRIGSRVNAHNVGYNVQFSCLL